MEVVGGGEGQDGRRAGTEPGRSDCVTDRRHLFVGRGEKAQGAPTVGEAALDLRADSGAEGADQQSKGIDHWETPPGVGEGAGERPAGTTAQGLRRPRDEGAEAIYAASAEGVASFAASTHSRGAIPKARSIRTASSSDGWRPRDTSW